MPPVRESSSGSLTGPPLWTLTAVVILVSGVLFYFVSEPLASAFDLLMPSSMLNRDADTAEPPPPPPAEPTEPEAPPPRIWTPAEIEAGLAAVGESLGALLEAGSTELPTFEDLGSSDEVKSQRADARWARWGVVWHNRLDAERAKLPPREQCLPKAGLQEACTEVHDILDQAGAIAAAQTYDDAGTRLKAAAERFDLYLHPPPEPEAEDGGESADATSTATN